MNELGGSPIVLREDEMQLSRGESVGDTARVLSRYVDAIVIRSGSHELVAELAAGADVPVVNALTPDHHPCQAIADVMTLVERFGDASGRRLAYVGDGNNVARSLAIVGAIAGVEVAVASPEGYELGESHGATLTRDPAAAVAGADAVYADVWVSMGDDETAGRAPRRRSPRTASTPPCSPAPRTERSRCTACRPTRARRSPPRSSTASARRYGTRPRTACTPRRPCSSCCLADLGPRLTPAPGPVV